MIYFEVNMLKDNKLLMSFREEYKGAAVKLSSILRSEGYDTEILELSDGPLFETVPPTLEWDEENFEQRY